MRLLIVLILTISTFTSVLINNSDISAAESNSIAKCRMPTFSEAYKDSKSIFVGKVTAVRTEGYKKIFTFQVEKYWKGVKSKTLEVQYYETMNFEAWLKIGGRYLVFAKLDDSGKLYDVKCTLTKDYSQSSPELKKLGKGKLVK